jgi:hypothetical protein
MILESDSCTLQSEFLIELSVLEGIDGVIHDGPSNTAYIKRQANAKISCHACCNSCIAYKYSRVEGEAKNELRDLEISLGRRV